MKLGETLIERALIGWLSRQGVHQAVTLPTAKIPPAVELATVAPAFQTKARRSSRSIARRRQKKCLPTVLLANEYGPTWDDIFACHMWDHLGPFPDADPDWR